MPPSTIHRSFKTRGSSYYLIQTSPEAKVAKEAQSPVYTSCASLAYSMATFLTKITWGGHFHKSGEKKGKKV